MASERCGGSADQGVIPKLVVFDLDYTLWPLWVDTHVNPPFTRAKHGTVLDCMGYEINLYKDVPTILQTLQVQGIPVAAASRTSAPDVAEELLHIMDMNKYFEYKEIYPGSKKAHFKRFHEVSGIAYTDMLFFDDEERNIHDVSRLGVTCVLAIHGITEELLQQGLRLFADRNGPAKKR